VFVDHAKRLSLTRDSGTDSLIMSPSAVRLDR